MSPRQRLDRHLTEWLGRWPASAASIVDVVGSVRREQPGWDGRVFPVLGVHSPESSVLSVRPEQAEQLRRIVDDRPWDDVIPDLPFLLGRDDPTVYSGIFRFCERPADLPDAGEWIAADDPVVPEWLHPFGREVLIARDPQTGAYLAGVGIKVHDEYGHELAVGTEEAARGRGLARRLVAQAARRVLDEGAVPTYQHDPRNIASAKVAEASGFPDLGWRSATLP